MSYLDDLKKIVSINSYTQNKHGVDEVGKIMSSWLGELGFEKITFKREVFNLI